MSGPPPKKQRTSTLPASTVPAGQAAIAMSRVQRIVKADKDVKICSKEAVFLITKAAELMLGKVTTQAYQNARMDKRQKMVRYTDLSAAVHNHSAWFYLGEVIPHPIPLSVALKNRQENDDVAERPAAVTTAAPSKNFDGKRVVKSKGGKGKIAPSDLSALGMGPGALGVGEELGQRKTRGKKLKLPAGEGGEGDEDDDFGEGEFDGGDDGDDGEYGGGAVSEAGSMEVDP
ncbi:hypothetical protein JCM8547_003312 [Rhodosporidiobolus lusitaniae]